ncbi:hypothetical protein MRB53_005445 [Persea americana]|uniref:Uncharacterized protein n=1 Tax=Persea americana TaxID=3435 RepID=A0ACC2MEW0_PERAE|nr:hypothetical protein MRB53_005445 [Persea americana]
MCPFLLSLNYSAGLKQRRPCSLYFGWKKQKEGSCNFFERENAMKVQRGRRLALEWSNGDASDAVRLGHEIDGWPTVMLGVESRGRERPIGESAGAKVGARVPVWVEIG